MNEKKKIRAKFRADCLERDNNCCRICKEPKSLNIHHITDRSEMPAGGYVKENGISLCEYCHLKAEQFHISGGKNWIDGFHPDDLYKMIGSSLDEAIKASYNRDGEE